VAGTFGGKLNGENRMKKQAKTRAKMTALIAIALLLSGCANVRMGAYWAGESSIRSITVQTTKQVVEIK
jgi:membrane protein YdbS with pleckstrin-like domain